MLRYSFDMADAADDIRPGNLEGLAGDALDLVFGVLQSVVGPLARGAIHPGGRLDAETPVDHVVGTERMGDLVVAHL